MNQDVAIDPGPIAGQFSGVSRDFAYSPQYDGYDTALHNVRELRLRTALKQQYGIVKRFRYVTGVPPNCVSEFSRQPVHIADGQNGRQQRRQQRRQQLRQQRRRSGVGW